jgi:hypothetical protein
MESNRHFTLVVIGDNPEELVKPYDNNIKVEPYKVYEFAKAKEYREQYITFYESLLRSKKLTDSERESINNALEYYHSLDDIDFYLELTNGNELDPETGDLMSDQNPNGKYDTCHIGKNLSMPLINKNGEEVFSGIKKDIDWNKIHLANKEVYERTWEMIMEGDKPKTDDEKTIYENMKNRTAYFEFFGTKDRYVLNSTAFWGYAVLDQKNGWRELEDNMSQIDWVSNFYDNFIKPLPENTRISIYECFRK